MSFGLNEFVIRVRICSASTYSTVVSFSRNVQLKSSSMSLILYTSLPPSQSQNAVILSQFSISAVREKLQDPSKATRFTPSPNKPHFVWAIPVPSRGVMIFISIRSLRISHAKQSKKCLSRSDKESFNPSISLISKAGNMLLDNPFVIALLSCSDKISLIIKRIRPPLYRKHAKPSHKILIAEEEKKPNFKSKVVALHKPSEKKPTGSHSLCDLNRRLSGQITFVFSIFF